MFRFMEGFKQPQHSIHPAPCCRRPVSTAHHLHTSCAKPAAFPCPPPAPGQRAASLGQHPPESGGAEGQEEAGAGPDAGHHPHRPRLARGAAPAALLCA